MKEDHVCTVLLSPEVPSFYDIQHDYDGDEEKASLVRMRWKGEAGREKRRHGLDEEVDLV